MKKTVLLAASVLTATAGFCQMQPITVSVMSSQGATMTAPINQLVTVAFDSTPSFYHAPLSLYTAMNGSGNASGMLPAGIPNLSHLTITTADPCNVAYVVQAVYSSSAPNYNIGVTLCASKRVGKVTLGTSTIPAANAKVYHIKKYFDAGQNAYVLTAIDSAVTDAGGNYHMNYGPVVTGASFYVKAALQANDPAYSNFLPTYNAASFTWSGATALAYPDYNSDNIPLVAGTNPGGPAFIGGSVLQGANKTSGVGDPLNRRILLLTDLSMHPVTYTYSDASGAFSFPHVPYGSYLLFGDALGKSNPPLTVTVSAAQPSVSNVIFEENSTKFQGRFGNLAVGQASGALAGISVYPNPASEVLHIAGLNTVAGAKSIVLMNALGATVYSRQLDAGEDGLIPVQSLPAGSYLLRLSTEAGVGSYRIVK